MLPPSLMVGEAQDIGPRIVRTESLAPHRDASAEMVAAVSVNPSGEEANQGKEMVTKQAMTID